MRNATQILCTILFAAAAGGAGAAEGGFYFGADFGVTSTTVGKSDGVFISVAPLPGLIFRVPPRLVESDIVSPGWGVTLGYRVNRYLGAEVGYTDFGSIDAEESYLVSPILFEGFAFSHELSSRVRGLSISALGILPVGESFELFARAGYLFADHEVTRQMGNGFHRDSAQSAEVWVIGGGVDFAMGPRWKGRFAFESLDTLRKTPDSGPIRLERYVFGVSYDF